MDRRQPTELEKYLFDLNGFIVIENALSKAELIACNQALDGMPEMQLNDWYGHIQCHNFSGKEGVNYQQIYEHEAFRCFIDHPSWIEYMLTFVGGQNNFDSKHGPLFIDENFANIRFPGDSIGLHSGGHDPTKRTRYQYKNGEFACGQVNVLVALNDVGPGDGATVVIPGSHKSNIKHPHFKTHTFDEGIADNIPGSRPVYLNAGDAIVFVDATAHGAEARTNGGQRRIAVFRYGPSWGFFRHGYRPSKELLESCDGFQRSIVWPHEPLVREPQVGV